jgi:hypothetical protein
LVKQIERRIWAHWRAEGLLQEAETLRARSHAVADRDERETIDIDTAADDAWHRFGEHMDEHQDALSPKARWSAWYLYGSPERDLSRIDRDRPVVDRGQGFEF